KSDAGKPAKTEGTKTAKAGKSDAGKPAKTEGTKTAKADKTKPQPVNTAATSKSKPGETKSAKADAVKAGAKAEGTKTAKADPAKAGAKAGRAKTAKATAPEPTYGAAQTIKVRLRKGETLEAAIRRAEASPDDAKTAAAQVQKALGKAPGVGQVFALEVAPRAGRVGAGRLMGLTLKSAALTDPVVLGRSKGGDLTLTGRAKLAVAKAETKADAKAASDDTSAPMVQRAKLITGEVRGSLFGSARKAGVGAGQIGEIVRAFAAKVDFQRDLKAGDKFTVVYDDDGKLLYARIKAKGSYRFARPGGEVMWLDDDGKSLKHGLLRTPVDGARMSSRFGLRIHPILGYAKMHQGIDFAAASGTPIMAAGDGEVVEIRRWGGYGNWLRIRHSGGYESGYAHLSRYASGLNVGDKVKQGQLVAYVGSTGASTGPHLHHEIWLNGQRVDPKGAKIPTGFALEGRELVAFKAQQAKVQAALGRGDSSRMVDGKPRTKVAGLRPAKHGDGDA
ncbi:MAG: peptidoglycan DD-metalloendopeptidase family protein, partial [Proteobacteria bacterium]|nr:peptidoglycan DD-metalloendopeptidase family protein [Pseudomonadota bacterium]